MTESYSEQRAMKKTLLFQKDVMIYLQSSLSDFNGEVMNVEQLLPTFSAKESLVLAEVEKMDVQWDSVPGHLQTLGSKIPVV